MPAPAVDPLTLVKPRREITGVTAVLLPYRGGQIDWPSFDSLLTRTLDAGLTPAVNMDTGYAHLLDHASRDAVLQRTRAITAGRRFVAGAFVGDQPGAPFDADAYANRTDAINDARGVPVVFPSYGLAHQPDDEVVANYRRLAGLTDEFIAFELGTVFAPFGRVYPLEVYRELMAIPRCSGAKHSSLRRDLEWERLALRDATRPDFKVYTGNDLAIDMVLYGSDYLLGLSGFAPDAFARRDALWAAGDPAWNELNDLLQHLGFLAFRDPVPAYKHAAAMFLHARGWLPTDETHPLSPPRGDADRELLGQVAEELDKKMGVKDQAICAPTSITRG